MTVSDSNEPAHSPAAQPSAPPSSQPPTLLGALLTITSDRAVTVNVMLLASVPIVAIVLLALILQPALGTALAATAAAGGGRWWWLRRQHRRRRR